MKSFKFGMAIVPALIAASIAFAQTPSRGKAAAPMASGEAHVIANADQAKFGPAPAAVGLPPGIEISPVAGDPSKPGLFSLLLKIPANGVIAPHSHPAEEDVVPLRGTFEIGDGTKFDESQLHALNPGELVHLPGKMHHFARAKGTTIVLVYGMGPFVINYVNPKDDPRGAPGH